MAGEREDLGFNIYALDKASRIFISLAEKVEKLDDKLARLDRRSVEVPVDVDTATGSENIDRLNTDLDELDRRRAEAKADVDTDDGKRGMDEIKAIVDEFDQMRADAEAGVDTDAGTRDLRELARRLDKIDVTQVEAEALVDLTKASSALRRYSAELDRMDGRQVTATADVETAIGTAKKHKLEANLDEFDRRHETASADVDVDRGRFHLAFLSRAFDRFFKDANGKTKEFFKFDDALINVLRYNAAQVTGIILAVLAVLPAAAAAAAGGIVLAFGGALAALGILTAYANEKVLAAFTKLKRHVSLVMQRITEPLIPALKRVAEIAQYNFDLITPALEKTFELMAPIITRFAGFFGRAISELSRAFVPLTRAFGVVLRDLGPIMVRVFSETADALIEMSRWVRRNHEDVAELLQFILRALPGAIRGITLFAEIWVRLRRSIVDTVTGGSKSFNQFKATVLPIVRDIAQVIRDNWGPISDWVRKNFGVIKDIVRLTLAIIRQLWQRYGEDITSIVRHIFGGIADQISGFLKIIRGILKVAMGLLTGDWRQAWSGIKDIVGGALQIIKGTVKTVFGVMTDIVRIAAKTLRDITRGLWDALRQLWKAGLDAVRSGLRTALDAVKSAFRSAYDAVKSATRSAWDAIKSAFRSALDAVKSAVRSALDTVRDIFRSAFDSVKSIARSAMDAVKSGIRTALDAIKTAFRTAKDAIGDIWGRVKALALAPVKFIVNVVYGKGIKPVVDAIPGVPDLPTVHLRKGGYTGPGSPDRLAGFVHADEFVIRSEARRKIERRAPGLLDRLNRDGDLWIGPGGEMEDRDRLLAGHRKGGKVSSRFEGALRWVRGQVGTPYEWSGVGGGGHGFDCSGLMSAITNFIRGLPLHHRVGSTADFPWGGFQPGPGAFTIGSTPNYGGSGIGHMAGTLLGTNVESAGGVGVRMGPSARGYRDPHFTEVAHLGPGGTFGSQIGLGFDLGNFQQEIGSVASGVLGAFDAVPDIVNKISDIQDQLSSMLDKGGWWPMIGKGIKSLMGDFKDWALDQLKAAGAWLKDESINIFGPAAVRAHDAWETITSPFDSGGTLRPGWNRVYNGTGRYEHLTPTDPGGRRRADGITIEHLEVKALGDRFDLHQVTQSLAWHLAG